MRRNFWPSILTLLTALAALAQPPAPTDDEIKQRIDRLAAKDKDIRLKAIAALPASSKSKSVELAVPALEKCIRDDAVMEVRREAVAKLANIAKDLGRPCPLVVIEAMLDKEDEPRWMASAMAGLFKTYAPGSVEVLLRGVKSEKSDIRSSCLHLIAHVGGKDKAVVDAIENAKKDPVFDVRHTAHIARFIVFNRLDEHVPYLIRVREEGEAILGKLPEGKEARNQLLCYRNLVILGGAMQMIEWSDKRADEFAAVLLKLLDDKSPLMRRGAAHLIGAGSIKVDIPKPVGDFPFQIPPTPALRDLVPFIEPDQKPKPEDKKPPEKSKLGIVLEKQKVEKRLRKLRDDDADENVRIVARLALARLAELNTPKRRE